MAWVSVDSSWLQAVDYRPEENALYVRFHKKGVPTVTCRYPNVDPDTAIGLLKAESKGRYFHQSGLYRRRYEVV